MENTRRKFIRQAGAITGAAATLSLLDMISVEHVQAATRKISHLSPSQAAMDEDYWFTIQQAYSVSSDIINLNNGGVSPQPLITQNALDRYVRICNEGPAYYMWNVLGQGRENVRNKLAELAGVSAEEIAINRNTSEGLETIIFGLDLKAGDEILTTNQDYPNMMNAWNQRVKRDGIKLTTISIPVPCKDSGDIVEAYKKAITPKTKIIHVSHVIFMTGQIMPVREIADMAHQHGIDVICDGAHSFAHLDYKISDLHCDYFGTSLHKWLCAPFGSGLMWIKKEKIEGLYPLFGAPKDFSTTDIRKFEHLGTRSFPIELAIGNSIDFHNGIGSKRKEERLRYLTHYWAEKVGKNPKVKFNTSLKSDMSCALCNFYIEGKEHSKVQDELFSKYKIYTTPITHDEFKGVRVTPHVYTKIADLDYFVKAVEKIASAS
jgi:selenocysteine lyase/cysteine desulfurase